MSLVKRAAAALQTARGQMYELGLRVADRFELGVLWQRYRKNTLTHGIEYLRGDQQVPVFSPEARGLPKWRAIPGQATPSLSKASVVRTEDNTVLLRGEYSGLASGMQLLRGDAAAVGHAAAPDALWGGAVGMCSTSRWHWDTSQHHWLEVRFRSDGARASPAAFSRARAAAQ